MPKLVLFSAMSRLYGLSSRTSALIAGVSRLGTSDSDETGFGRQARRVLPSDFRGVVPRQSTVYKNYVKQRCKRLVIEAHSEANARVPSLVWKSTVTRRRKYGCNKCVHGEELDAAMLCGVSGAR